MAPGPRLPGAGDDLTQGRRIAGEGRGQQAWDERIGALDLAGVGGPGALRIAAVKRESGPDPPGRSDGGIESAVAVAPVQRVAKPILQVYARLVVAPAGREA